MVNLSDGELLPAYGGKLGESSSGANKPPPTATPARASTSPPATRPSRVTARCSASGATPTNSTPSAASRASSAFRARVARARRLDRRRRHEDLDRRRARALRQRRRRSRQPLRQRHPRRATRRRSSFSITSRSANSIRRSRPRSCAAAREACRAHDCALLGGETAEMPGLYKPAHFDLAGTIVGIVDVDALSRARRRRAGDAIVGLPAVGLHTNGYSLARALIDRRRMERALRRGRRTATRCSPSIRRTTTKCARSARRRVKAMAHITGGGLLENVAAHAAPGVKAVFEQRAGACRRSCEELVRRGNLRHEERYRDAQHGHRLHADRAGHRRGGRGRRGLGRERRRLDRNARGGRAAGSHPQLTC